MPVWHEREKRNLITGTRYMNIEGMLPYEMQVCDFIFAGGGRVYYKVTPDFRDGELVARGVRIQAYSLADRARASISMSTAITFSLATGLITPRAKRRK